MWWERFSAGVLRVLTPLGPRYIRPSTVQQRLYLIWIFRHFPSLPHQVLSPRQRKLIDRLCSEQWSTSQIDCKDSPIIGTIERLPAFSSSEAAPTPVERGLGHRTYNR